MKKQIFLGLLGVVLLLCSCKKFVSKDDVSPNSPSQIPLSVQLPTTDLVIFATYGGGMARNAITWTQQMVGVQGQSQDYAQYIFNETDVTNDWQTLYSSGIVNTKEIIAHSGNKNPYYKGAAQFKEALMLGILTDYWGDVPFREAGLGNDNLTPHYDSQEQVIGDIQSLLDSAILNFQRPEGDNDNLPYTYDLINLQDPNNPDGAAYIAKYLQAAHILKARYHLRLSKVDPAAADKALADIASIESPTSGSDLYMNYGSNSANNNQYYSFEQNRQGYMRASSAFVDTLAKYNDPRLSHYFANGLKADGVTDSTIYGTVTAGSQSASYISSELAGSASSLPLVTYAEALFIKAEALARKGQLTDAQTAYQAGITASMGRFPGISAGDMGNYISARGTLVGDGLAQILYEKYVHNFLNPEVWADWRRTGYPALLPEPTATLKQIPRRYPTEQTERLNNPNAKVVSDLITPVWWDKQ